MDDDRQQRARELLQQSEDEFRLSDQHQAMGAALFKQYRALMYQDWDGSTIGEGEG